MRDILLPDLYGSLFVSYVIVGYLFVCLFVSLFARVTVRRWGYRSNPDGSQQGMSCFYCYRVCINRFRTKGYSMVQTVQWLGAEESQYEQFVAFVKIMVKYMIEHGGGYCA